MEIYQNFVPVTMSLEEVIIITSIFSAIRFRAAENPFVVAIFASCGILSFIMLKKATELAASVTRSSEEISKLENTLRHSFSKSDKQFFKSCNPLKFNIANLFTLTPGTFRRITNDIIIQNVINLLIAY